MPYVSGQMMNFSKINFLYKELSTSLSEFASYLIVVVGSKG